ncbi:MAG: hypothetical protein WCL19_07295 [Verrucomicrobiota bacterium]
MLALNLIHLNGNTCLNWWRDRCIEWCHARPQDGKFADQKYLDQWPELFGNVAILQNPGVNVAACNLAGIDLCHDRGITTVDGHPLIFYHFHSLWEISTMLYEMAYKVYRVRPCRVLRDRVLSPYLQRLRALEKQIQSRATAPFKTLSLRTAADASPKIWHS